MEAETGPKLTLAGVVAGGGGCRGLQGGTGGRAGAQGGDHFHHAGHEHVCGAHGAAALQHGPVGLLLDVHVRLHGHGLPAARGVNGDLLVVGAAGDVCRSRARAHTGALPSTFPGPRATTRGLNRALSHLCQASQSCRAGSERGTYFWM